MNAILTAETTVSNERLTHLVEIQLRSRIGHVVQGFQMTAHLNGLILHGRSATYFAKQMAQEVVMEATRLQIEDNRIEVS